MNRSIFKEFSKIEKSDYLIGINELGDIFSSDLYSSKHICIGGETGSSFENMSKQIALSLMTKYSSEDIKFLIYDSLKVEFNFLENSSYLYKNKIFNRSEDFFDELKSLLELIDVRVEEYSNNEKQNYPLTVVIIDELLDFLEENPEYEEVITKLLQISARFKIHFIINTRKLNLLSKYPAIKNNLPTRMLGKVKSGKTGREFLGITSGAELKPGEIIVSLNNFRSVFVVKMLYVFEDKNLLEELISGDYYKKTAN